MSAPTSSPKCLRHYLALINIILMSCALKVMAQGPGYFGNLQEHFPDEGQEVSVKFLSKLTHTVDLLTRKYHVIQLQLREDHVLDMHLVNSDHHPYLDHGRDSSHTLFRGKLHPQGSVAVTADETGFSGHIIYANEHFIIEPRVIKGQVSLRRRKRSTTTIPHVLYKVDTLSKYDNQTHPDVAHVPKDELEKAIAEMQNATASLTSTTPSPDSDDDDDTLLEEASDDDKEDGNEIVDLFASSSRRKKGNRPQKGQSSPTRTSKMSIQGQKVVDIAIFTDPKLYKMWETRYPKDAKTKLKAFILNLVNNMDVLYQQSTLGVAISFRIVHLEMMTSNPSGLDSTSGQATKYLKSFCKYAGNKNDKGGKWDHALLITGEDLIEGSDNLVAGMAWFSTMCLKYWSCSISEGTSFSSSYILTHEIGHSLGMDHDGTGPSKACDSNKYLMSPTTGVGKVTWSPCSAKNLKDFITKGTPEVNKQDLTAVPTCLARSSSLKNQRVSFQSAKLPGQSYGLDVQCVYECGSKCSPYIKNPQDVCSMLYCEEPAGKLYKNVKAAHPALEGSPCGQGKNCRSGKCVKSSG